MLLNFLFSSIYLCFLWRKVIYRRVSTRMAEIHGNRWRIDLFGALTVESPEGDRSFPGNGKAAEVLAYLAAHPDEPINRQRLADRIWMDSEAAGVRTRLRQELHKLRALYPFNSAGALLTSHPDFVQIEPNTITDLAQFRSLLVAAETSGSEQDQTEKLLAAADIYSHGPLLAPFESLWAVQLRAAESARLAAALSARIDKDLASGEGAATQRMITALHLVDPHKANRYRAMRLPIAKRTAATNIIEMQGVHGKDDVGSEEPADDQNDTHTTPAINKALPPTVNPPAALVPRFAAAAVVILIAIGLVALKHPNKEKIRVPERTGLPHISWVYRKGAAASKSATSSATCITHCSSYWVVAGITDTDKEDTDILTVCIGKDGHERWARRFTGEKHDCDRVFSVAANDEQPIFVAGESYDPQAEAGKGAWRALLLAYSSSGDLLWHHYSDTPTLNKDHRIAVKPDGIGGCYLGCTELVKGIPRAVVTHYDMHGNTQWSRPVVPDRTPAQKSLFQDLDTDTRGGLTAAALSGDTAGGHATLSWCAASYDIDGKVHFQRTQIASVPEVAECKLMLRETKGNRTYLCGSVAPQHPAEESDIVVLALSEDGTTLWQHTVTMPGVQRRLYCMALGPGNEIAVGTNSVLPTGVLTGAVTLISSYGNQMWQATNLAPDGTESCQVRAIDINVSDEISGLIAGAPGGFHSFDGEMRVQTVLWKMDGKEIGRGNPLPYSKGDRQIGLCLTMDGRHLVTAGQQSILGASPTLFASQLDFSAAK
jgi:DNA-binding SARP family transcriptional activator